MESYLAIEGPFRVVAVSDASGTTKTSNYPTEGSAVLLGPDLVNNVGTDKNEFLLPEQQSFSVENFIC